MFPPDREAAKHAVDTVDAFQNGQAQGMGAP